MKSLLTIAMIVMAAQVMAQDSGSEKKNSFGVGLGVPYGVLGANVDVNVLPNLNVSAGVGTTVIAGIGYNAGFKYFISPSENKFRPRVSAYYGINGAAELKGGPSNGKKTYRGLSIGGGFQWMWGDRTSGLDCDIIYLATSGLDIDKLKDQGYSVTDPGKIKISIGYRRAF